MTTTNYIVCFFVSLLAAGLHFIQNMNSQKKIAKKGNFLFTEKMYLSDEKWSVVGSVIFSAIMIVVFGEAVTEQGTLFNWKYSIFALIGYGGDSLAGKLFGQYAGRFIPALDDKTTKADALNPDPTEPTPMIVPKDLKK